MSSSNSHSPCAACKFLRRKCTQECVFAPYFPPDQPQKFASVHRVYGASNVAKILNEMPVAHREEAVGSLVYEAEARLRDPVYGCVGFISYLHARLKQVQAETLAARKELAAYIGSSQAAMLGVYPASASAAADPAAGNPQLALLQQQQQQQMMIAAALETSHQGYPGSGSYAAATAGEAVVDGEIYPGLVQVQQQPHLTHLNHLDHHHQDYHHHHLQENNMIQGQLFLNNVPHHQEPGADNNNNHLEG